MRPVVTGVGVALVLAGAVWFLQGTGVLPGSFMSGEPFWAWAGLLCLVSGASLLFFTLGSAGRDRGQG